MFHIPCGQEAKATLNKLRYILDVHELSCASSSRVRPASRCTLFLLTSDHGGIDTPLDRTIYLHQHADLLSHLVMDYAGEPRAAYLYVRNGELDATRDYLASRLSEQFFVTSSQRALDAGLFGSGKIAAEAKFRIGDLIALPREDWIIWDRDERPTSRGRHAGLSEQEMLVPLITARLDA
jgi:type I phosphodiesterase/nucleotide pyrophosphatase